MACPFNTKLGIRRWGQRLAGRLSPRGRARALLLYCLLAAGYSGSLVAGCSGGSPAPLPPLQVPGPVAGNELPRPSLRISPTEYARVQAGRRYLDSLAASPAGRKERDSLLARYPGLPDSLLLFEQLYQSQPLKP